MLTLPQMPCGRSESFNALMSRQLYCIYTNLFTSLHMLSDIIIVSNNKMLMHVYTIQLCKLPNNLSSWSCNMFNSINNVV